MPKMKFKEWQMRNNSLKLKFNFKEEKWNKLKNKNKEQKNNYKTPKIKLKQ